VRQFVATKHDLYKAIITKRLNTYPELTAVWLFEEVRAAGTDLRKVSKRSFRERFIPKI
jgi:hypothetical protein